MPAKRSGPTRLSAAIGMAALLLASAATSVRAGLLDDLNPFATTPSKMIVIFVDITSSILAEDWTIYRDTVSTLVDADAKKSWLKPGDRMVIAPISSQTVANFYTACDITTKPAEKPSQRREANEKLQKGLSKTFDDLRQMQANKPSSKTNIIEAIRAAQQIFAGETQRKERYLLLLSDMTEESDVNFKSTTLTPAFADKLIAKQRTANSFPDLKGVKVFAVGAGGDAKKPAKYEEIKGFWLKYLTEAGVMPQDISYARIPFNFSTLN